MDPDTPRLPADRLTSPPNKDLDFRNCQLPTGPSRNPQTNPAPVGGQEETTQNDEAGATRRKQEVVVTGTGKDLYCFGGAAPACWGGCGRYRSGPQGPRRQAPPPNWLSLTPKGRTTFQRQLAALRRIVGNLPESAK